MRTTGRMVDMQQDKVWKFESSSRGWKMGDKVAHRSRQLCVHSHKKPGRMDSSVHQCVHQRGYHQQPEYLSTGIELLTVVKFERE